MGLSFTGQSHEVIRALSEIGILCWLQVDEDSSTPYFPKITYNFPSSPDPMKFKGQIHSYMYMYDNSPNHLNADGFVWKTRRDMG